jgi:hypothetical protein
MDAGPVSRAAHEAVEYIQFAYEMTLANSANRGVARHLPDVFGTESYQANTRPAASRCSGSFASGVTGPNDDDVKHVVRPSRFMREGKSSETTRDVSRETSLT